MRLRAIAFITLILGCAALGAVALGRAATPPPSLSLTVTPKPVVTAGHQALVLAKFSYGENSSPTTLSNVYLEVYIPPDSFHRAFSDSACAVDREDATLATDSGTVTVDVVRCSIGHVRAGGSQILRQVAVTAPAAQSTLTVYGKALWNEGGNDNNPQTPNDATSLKLDSADVTGASAVNAAGRCTAGGDVLETSASFGAANRQSTVLNFGANNQGFNCTPAAIQDDVEFAGRSCWGGSRPCRFSTIFVPTATSPATATITFEGSLFPPPGSPPNPATFRVLEHESGEPVPLCPDRTSLGTCQTGAERFGSRGIRVFLSVTGGIDPSYGG